MWKVTYSSKRLTKKKFKDEFGIAVSDAQLNELKKKLRNLTMKVSNPSPYYAVIKLDGDNMGKWLSGAQLPEIRKVYNSQVWEKLPVDFKKETRKFFQVGKSSLRRNSRFCFKRVT